VCQCEPLTPGTFDIAVCHAFESAGCIKQQPGDERAINRWSKKIARFDRKLSRARDLLLLKDRPDRATKVLERSVLRRLDRFISRVPRDAERGKINDATKDKIIGEMERLKADVESIVDGI